MDDEPPQDVADLDGSGEEGNRAIEIVDRELPDPFHGLAVNLFVARRQGTDLPRALEVRRFQAATDV